MTKVRLVRSILLIELAGFGLVFCVLWCNEFLDLPHHLFGEPATPVNWMECVMETVLVGLVAVLVTLDVVRLLNRVRYLEGFLPVCSFCKRIRHEGQWIPLEAYIRDNSEARMTHGFCPECVIREYPSVPREAVDPSLGSR